MLRIGVLVGLEQEDTRPQNDSIPSSIVVKSLLIGKLRLNLFLHTHGTKKIPSQSGYGRTYLCDRITHIKKIENIFS